MRCFTRLIILLLIFLLGTLLVHADDKGTLVDQAVLPGNKEVKLEFEQLQHFIVVKTKLAGSAKDYFFIIDTGMKVNVISNRLLSEVWTKKLGEGFATDTTDTTSKLTTLQIDTIKVGECQVNNAIAVMSDLTALSNITGREISGIIGDNFLRLFKVTIDYQNKEVTLSSAGNRNPSPTIKTAKRPKFMPIYIPLVVDGNIINCVLDTGASDINLPLEFLQKLDYPQEEKIYSKGSMSGGLLGTSKGDILARIRNIKVGGTELLNYPVNSVSNNLALLGYKFLSRFRIIIDYPNDEISLIPYETLAFHNNVYGVGLALIKSDNGDAVIKGIWGGSPADKQNLRIGDKVLEINHRKVFEFSQPEIVSLLHDDNVKQLDMLIISDGLAREVLLNKEFLFPSVK